jgi:hypothetical protein
VEYWLTNVTPSLFEDRRTIIASYLQSLYQIAGSTTGVDSDLVTDFSLVFDDSGFFHETLWSKFHKYKWDRYKNSEMLTADIKMDSYDWEQMQINRPLKYRKELYSLVSIEGFNPLTKTATINIIKKL